MYNSCTNISGKDTDSKEERKKKKNDTINVGKVTETPFPPSCVIYIYIYGMHIT